MVGINPKFGPTAPKPLEKGLQESPKVGQTEVEAHEAHEAHEGHEVHNPLGMGEAEAKSREILEHYETSAWVKEAYVTAKEELNKVIGRHRPLGQGPVKFGKLAVAGRVFTGATAVANLTATPGLVLTASADVRAALRVNSLDSWLNAGESVGSAALTAGWGLQGAMETGLHMTSTYRAVASFFRAAPQVAPSVAKAATGGAKALVGSGERALVKAAIHGGEGAAITAGKVAGGKLMQRLAGAVPIAGAVAIAGLAVADVATVIKDFRDPNASQAKLIASTVTAVGSVMAATQIPIVSQVGVGISAVGAIVRGYFWG